MSRAAARTGKDGKKKEEELINYQRKVGGSI